MSVSIIKEIIKSITPQDHVNICKFYKTLTWVQIVVFDSFFEWLSPNISQYRVK